MTNVAEKSHKHGPGCGHVAVQHGNHIDYLQNGMMQKPDGNSCVVTIDQINPEKCAPHTCKGHDAAHKHGPACGHEAVPHGNHVDYLVQGHLHHVHNGHCDDHGPLKLKA